MSIFVEIRADVNCPANLPFQKLQSEIRVDNGEMICLTREISHVSLITERLTLKYMMVYFVLNRCFVVVVVSY